MVLSKCDYVLLEACPFSIIQGVAHEHADIREEVAASSNN